MWLSFASTLSAFYRLSYASVSLLCSSATAGHSCRLHADSSRYYRHTRVPRIHHPVKIVIHHLSVCLSYLYLMWLLNVFDSYNLTLCPNDLITSWICSDSKCDCLSVSVSLVIFVAFQVSPASECWLNLVLLESFLLLLFLLFVHLLSMLTVTPVILWLCRGLWIYRSSFYCVLCQSAAAVSLSWSHQNLKISLCRQLKRKLKSEVPDHEDSS